MKNSYFTNIQQRYKCVNYVCVCWGGVECRMKRRAYKMMRVP